MFKVKHIIIASILILMLSVTFVSIIFYKNYYSKINYAGSFSIKINGLNYNELKKIKFILKTPRDLLIESTAYASLSHINYGENRPFNNLYISIPDSLLSKINYLSISYKKHFYNYNKNEFINNWKIDKKNNSKLTKNYKVPSVIKKNTSVFSKLLSILFVIDSLLITDHLFIYLFCFLILIFLPLTLYYVFGSIYFTLLFQKLVNYKKLLVKSIIYLLFLAIFIFHLNKALSGYYFFSTGHIFIISVFIVIYYILKYIIKFFKIKNSNPANIRLMIISICFSFIIAESVLQIKKIYPLDLEKRNSLFYNSVLSSSEPDWFHTRTAFSSYYLKSNEYKFPRKANSLGLSDIESNFSKVCNEYRIIGIGDSFTEGDGADKDSTWLKELKRQILKNNLKQNFSFINAGICGSDPFFEYVLLKEKLLDYKPDLVIVTLNYSDIDDILIRGGMERFKKDGRVKYIYKPDFLLLYESSHIARLIMHNAFRYNYLLLKDDEYTIMRDNSKKMIYQSIELFSNLAKNNNFKLLVVFHPMKINILDSYFNDFSGIISEIEKKLPDVEVLNMYDYFQNIEHINNTNCYDYYWKIDGHNTGKGYCAFGRGVFYELKQLGIIDSLRNNYK